MTHTQLNWMTVVGTSVFLLAACLILALSTMTFAAIWVGRGSGGPQSPRAPRPPLEPGDPQ